MALDLSAFDAALKEFYEEGARTLLNNEIIGFKELEETQKPWSGRRVVSLFKTGRSNAVGARAENGTLPTHSNQAWANCIVSATYQYGVIRLSGPVIKSGDGNAFINAVSSEMAGMVDDLKNDLSRQFHGYGDGRIAQVAAAVASASNVTLYNRFAEPGQPGARFLYRGMSLDFGTIASPTALASSQVVSTIAISANPATTTDSVTVTASTINASQCETFVFNRGAGGQGLELMGLQGLLDEYTQSNIFSSNAFQSATVQNISRATVTNWNASVLENSGVARVIDSHLMETAFDRISTESGLEADTIWGHHGSVRAFLESVASDRRYTSADFDAGRKKLSYNGIDLIRDRHGAYNALLILKKSVIKTYTLSDFAWADADGAILSRVSSVDAWEAFLACYKNIGIDDNPRGACWIRDILVDF